MNIKCIKVAKANNYKGLCIRHTFVKREDDSIRQKIEARETIYNTEQ